MIDKHSEMRWRAYDAMKVFYRFDEWVAPALACAKRTQLRLALGCSHATIAGSA